ncbi:MAG: alginate lyase family protein [Planctomycetes bacterium]|nr:alginate lyase family protein [Planctomycetota bacterium]
MTLQAWARWLRTVRHLQAEQAAWRLARVLTRNWPERLPHLSCAPATRAAFPGLPLLHRPKPQGAACLDHLRHGRIELLHQCFDLDPSAPDWRLGARQTQRLETITLHYHAWLYELLLAARERPAHSAQAIQTAEGLLDSWLRQCDLDAPGSRDLAWNSFAIATRLTWWLRALPLSTDALKDRMLSSAYRQAAYLHAHLEWDLRGNHLLRDAVGLAWAGRFFEDREAQRWLETASRLALEQVQEQVLPDGGHFERSPMYHLHVMEDVLHLALLIPEPSVGVRLRAAWGRMAEFAAWIRHSDGAVALFNDGGFNGACSPEAMLTVGAAALGLSVDARSRQGGRHFKDVGLLVWHGSPWSVFFDAGDIGPDYQPGHAHADTLALEVSYQGTRLFVDPGTYGYDHDARRRYDRSTAAHNTVCVDDQDSSEVWHIFRVGRRAKVLGVEAHFGADGFSAEADHDGYAHLEGRPRHFRRVEVRAEADLSVRDRIEGTGRHRVEGGWLLAPEWQASPTPGGWEVVNGALRVAVRLDGPDGVRLSTAEAAYHPEYGLEHRTVRLQWAWEGELPFGLTTRVEPS